MIEYVAVENILRKDDSISFKDSEGDKYQLYIKHHLDKDIIKFTFQLNYLYCKIKCDEDYEAMINLGSVTLKSEYFKKIVLDLRTFIRETFDKNDLKISDSTLSKIMIIFECEFGG